MVVQARLAVIFLIKSCGCERAHPQNKIRSMLRAGWLGQFKQDFPHWPEPQGLAGFTEPPLLARPVAATRVRLAANWTTRTVCVSPFM